MKTLSLACLSPSTTKP